MYVSCAMGSGQGRQKLAFTKQTTDITEYSAVAKDITEREWVGYEVFWEEMALELSSELSSSGIWRREKMGERVMCI